MKTIGGLAFLIGFCVLPFVAKAQIKPNGALSAQSTLTAVGLPQAGSSTINYVRSFQPQKPISDPNQIHRTTSVQEVQQSTQYLDGLGRPLQSVSKGISPLGKDVVAPVVYDEFGRQVYNYLPYVASSASDGSFKTNPFAEQQSFMQQQYGAQGETFFYGKIDYEPAPLNRVKKTMAPGNSWAGSNRGIELSYEINAVGEVRVWNIDFSIGAIPTTAAHYNAGELARTVIKDEHDKRVLEYHNKEGQLILKKVELVANADIASHSGWLCTYYVYDDMGNLRFVIPPKASEQVAAYGSVSADIANELCFRYEYDSRSRMIVKKVPGAAEVYMVYDERDRLVFTQDGNQRPGYQWTTFLYDALNRPVMTGITTYYGTRQQLQDYNATPGNSTIETNITTTGSNAGSSAGSTFTSTVSVNGNPIPSGATLVPLTITYYDNYGWTNKQYDNSNNSKLESGVNPYPETIPSAASQIVSSLVTGTRTRMLENVNDLAAGKWLEEVIFYDDKGRPVQTQADNHKGGNDAITSRYNFSGDIISTYHKHTISSASTAVATILNYDAAGRLLDITKQLNDNAATRRVIASNSYDEPGQLKTKTLFANGGAGGGPLEVLKYDYNIRNWLTGINKGYATGTSSSGVWFGMQLSYDYGFSVFSGGATGSSGGGSLPAHLSINTRELGRLLYQATTEIVFAPDESQPNAGFESETNAEFTAEITTGSTGGTGSTTSAPMGYYNGNISGLQWRSKGDGEQRAYGFGYDAANRLLKSDFTQNTGGWNTSAGVDFSMKLGDGINATSAYDGNGNILAMNQTGLKLNGSSTIDQLQYSYNGGNKLQQVTDAVNDNNSRLGDFKYDPATKTPVDYGYDANGNLISDQNKKITSITYNHLNLPAVINVAGKGRITYIYDADGNKLQKITIDNTLSPAKTTTTDYIGGFVYEQVNNDVAQLKFLLHEEGRIRYEKATQSTCPVLPDRFVYDYFIRDHLGNVRMVLTEEQKSDCYPPATVEPSKVQTEKQVYDITDGRIIDKSSTGASSISSFEEKIYRTHGGLTNEKTGLSAVLKVMSGDKVKIKAESFYTLPNEGAGSTLTMTLTELLTTMVGSGAIASKGSVTTSSVSGIGNNTNTLTNFINNNTTGSTTAKAYVNWILFDDQLKHVAAGVDPVQANGGYKLHEAFINSPVNVTKNGYLYVFVSNESNLPVYFDNLQVTHVRGPLLEESHYYPFGLVQQGISSKAAGVLDNEFKYNDKELNTDLALDWYEYGFRNNFDAQIGRFHSVDPLASLYDHYSPYQFAGNEVPNAIDIDGLEPYRVNVPQIQLNDFVNDGLSAIGEMLDGVFVHSSMNSGPGASGFLSGFLKNASGVNINLAPILKRPKDYQPGFIAPPNNAVISASRTTPTFLEMVESGHLGAELFGPYHMVNSVYVGAQAFVHTQRGYSKTLSGHAANTTFDERFLNGAGFLTMPLSSGIGGMAAKGGVTAVEEIAVHGNSLKSLKPTWGYKLYSQDGTFLKNGITNKLIPESRYTKAFMSDKYMVPFKQFPSRLGAYQWEFQQNQILRGPLNFNMH